MAKIGKGVIVWPIVRVSYPWKTKIGYGVWFATDVYIAPGFTIEDDALVGARSSVFKNFEGNFIYLDSPAKKVKRRYVD